MKNNYAFTKTIAKGLLGVLPVAVNGDSIYTLWQSLESSSAWLLHWGLPDRFYFPGVGVAFATLLVYGIGMLMNTRTAQRLSNYWERFMHRIPFVKSLYGAVQDIVTFLSSNKSKKFNKVVALTLKESKIRMIGFVTQENLASLPQVTGSSDMVVVYLPMSYQIGGYMVMVPRSSLELIDMSIEDASRLVFTAGMSIQKTEPVETRTKAHTKKLPD